MPASLRGQSAFTKLELLVVIGLLFLLLGMITPPFAHRNNAKSKAQRIRCVNNLKNLGLAFRLASNPDGTFPWQSTTTSPTNLPAENELTMYFLKLTNDLPTPALLHCSADQEKSRADSWTNFSSKNINYFLGLGADESSPQMFLAGDRNLTHTGLQLPFGRVKIPHAAGTNLIWTPAIHKHQGNVALADGSVHQLNNTQVRDQFRAALRSNSSDPVTFLFP